MAYEQKPGGGSLFKNTKKTTEKQPDYRGEIVTPDGTKFSLAGWIKQSAKGSFLSLKCEVPKSGTSTPSDDMPF